MWLHGDPRGSVIQSKGTAKLLGHNPKLQNYHQDKLTYPPVKLGSDQRKIVLAAIVEHCDVKGWQLFAAHIRSNHVHILVGAYKPDLVADFKSWATRKLRANGYDMPRVWTQGGSMQYLFKDDEIKEKVDYIINQQGDMMEYYVCH